MNKSKSSKKNKASASTYERITQDPVRKAELEKEYKELLLEEFFIALNEKDLDAMKKLTAALGYEIVLEKF